MEEVQQESEAEGEKDDVGASNIAIDNNGNSESDDQKPRAGIWRVTGPARRSTRGNWTEEEDKILQAAVQRFKGKCWKKIAECVPNRTDVQCLHRWQKVLNPDLVKGPWTKEEDDLIVELVRKEGSKKWSELAKHLPGRIGKQCRERWHNHLNPDINKNPWTREEELILIEAHSKYGNKWAEIAKHLHGRSENSIKNHWNCSLRKKLEQNLSRSGFDHPEFATPIPCSTKAETGNGVESVVKQSPGAGLFVEQNCKVISDFCSVDLILGNSKGRESYLQASQRANHSFPSKQASNTIELPSLLSTEFKQNQDKSDNDNDKSSSDCHPGILKLSNVFATKQVFAQSSCYNQQHLIKSPFKRYNSPYQPLLLNSIQGVIDGSKNAYLTGGYDFSGRSEMEHGSSLSKDRNNFSFIRPSVSSSPTFRINGSNEQQKTTNQIWKSLAGDGYAGLCYEPLQMKDLKIFLSTGKFPSTESYIRIPASSPTVEDTQIHEKRPYAYSCPKSILRRAAMTYQNTPSIIRKPRLPKHASNVQKQIDDGNIHRSVEDFASPQKTRKLENSFAINSVGKSLKEAFDIVWDQRK